jgi:hypothetical protein
MGIGCVTSEAVRCEEIEDEAAASRNVLDVAREYYGAAVPTLQTGRADASSICPRFPAGSTRLWTVSLKSEQDDYRFCLKLDVHTGRRFDTAGRRFPTFERRHRVVLTFPKWAISRRHGNALQALKSRMSCGKDNKTPWQTGLTTPV